MIYKYGLNYNTTSLTLPKSSKLLSVGFQGDNLVLWVDTSPNEPEELMLYAYTTGSEVKKGHVYVGTAMTADGTFVLHVYRDFSMCDLFKGMF